MPPSLCLSKQLLNSVFIGQMNSLLGSASISALMRYTLLIIQRFYLRRILLLYYFALYFEGWG